MAYNYASIGKEWIERNENGNPTGESILPHDTVDYQITKILALMKVGVEQATEWANDGTINPFMSVKEIKDIVKEWEKEIAYCENDVLAASEYIQQETAEQETETESEQATENKPFNVTELLTRIANQMNEYNKNGKTEQIETLKWVIEQVQEMEKV